jgi:hypothetical protein
MPLSDEAREDHITELMYMPAAALITRILLTHGNSRDEDLVRLVVKKFKANDFEPPEMEAIQEAIGYLNEQELVHHSEYIGLTDTGHEVAKELWALHLALSGQKPVERESLE